MEQEWMSPKLQSIYLQYAPMVYKQALLSLHNHCDSEDIVQEVFLRVVRNWDSFRGEALVKTWILRIAKNCIIDAVRTRHKHQRLVEESRAMHPTFQTLDTLVEIESMLDGVSQKDRTVLQLRVVHDLSVADTAEILGCSQGKIRVDAHRAMLRLRQMLRAAEPSG